MDCRPYAKIRSKAMSDQTPPSSLTQRDYELPSERIGRTGDALAGGLADAREAAAKLNLAKEERLAAINTALEAKLAMIDRRRDDLKAERSAEIARHDEAMDALRNADAAVSAKEANVTAAAERDRQTVIDWHAAEMAANDRLARGMALALEEVRGSA
jgi:hypothetical protein